MASSLTIEDYFGMSVSEYYSLPTRHQRVIRDKISSLTELEIRCMVFIKSLGPNAIEGEDYIIKKIKFDNDDVPKYLKHLRELKARPSTITTPTGTSYATRAA